MNKNGESYSSAIESHRKKERCIRGYYKPRIADLIHALEATRLVEQTSNILGEPIPNDPVLVLNIALKNKQNI